jgi:hypothetical protein
MKGDCLHFLAFVYENGEGKAIIPNDLQIWMASMQIADCSMVRRIPENKKKARLNAKRKKFIFHSGPETQYLLVTVMLIEARQ